LNYNRPVGRCAVGRLRNPVSGKVRAINEMTNTHLYLCLLGYVKTCWRMFLASILGMAVSAQLHRMQFEWNESVRENEQ